MLQKINLFEFKENIFEIVGKDFALIAAGTIEAMNAMTIAWATFGVLWGKNVINTYVRPSRFTYQFMEQNDYFTVSFYAKDHQKALGVFGTKSGRDVDKVMLTGFHPIQVEDKSVSFAEARLTFLCKKIYIQDLDQKVIGEDIKKSYYPKDDFHRMYVGEIVAGYQHT